MYEKKNTNNTTTTGSPAKRERKPLPRRKELTRKASLKKLKVAPSQMSSSFSHKSEIGKEAYPFLKPKLCHIYIVAHHNPLGLIVSLHLRVL